MSNPAVIGPDPSALEKEMDQDAEQSWFSRFIRGVINPSSGTIALAILLALVIGALIVVIFDPAVQKAAGYIFAQPADFFTEAWRAFSEFFFALFKGSIFDFRARSFSAAIYPLVESFVRAIPLIIAGLAVALSFTAGLFNIGVQGQLIMGALLGGFIGFTFEMPAGLHLLAALAGALVGGAIYGFIPGILKARLGANEVIVTIMLNSIAALFLAAMLSTKTFYGEGISGKSMKIKSTAMYPSLLGSDFRLHMGLIVAILATIFVWWLLDRSTFGFELRAAGANPAAARTAGINVKKVTVLALTISGALAGLAATAPLLGTEYVITGGIAGSIGFDAITVALLGRSRPLGVFFAGLLFGALNAGGANLQVSAGVPVDIVLVTQAIIVLTIAASEAIRAARVKKKIKEATVEKVESADAKETKQNNEMEGVGA